MIVGSERFGPYDRTRALQIMSKKVSAAWNSKQKKKSDESTTYEPTAEEIAMACQEIQALWSASERQKRLRVDWRAMGVELPQHREPYHRRETQCV